MGAEDYEWRVTADEIRSRCSRRNYRNGAAPCRDEVCASRSRTLARLFVLTAAAAFSADGAASDYPARPIRMLVGFTAGGGSDIAARNVAQKLSEDFGQSVVVDNRTGATGAIAAQTVAKAQPDGYTLMMLAVAQVVANAFDDKLAYNSARDFAAVSYVS